jgi:hypothetical protein
VDEDDASPEVQLAALRRAMDEAKENEVGALFSTEQQSDPTPVGLATCDSNLCGTSDLCTTAVAHLLKQQDHREAE